MFVHKMTFDCYLHTILVFIVLQTHASVSAPWTRASCAVLHSSDGVDPRGDTGSLRSPTRVALSRSVAIDQNTTEDDQLQEGLDPLRIYPDRQPTLRTAEEELPIVVPCSRLMAISRRLRSNLTQLMVRTLSHDSPTCTLIILLWSQITWLNWNYCGRMHSVLVQLTSSAI